MAADLLPCPCCNGPARLLCLSGGYWQASCAECYTSGGLAVTERDAAARWNRRAPAVRPDPAPGTVRASIPVAVAPDGFWHAFGSHLGDRGSLALGSLPRNKQPGARVVYVVADLPLPAEPVVVAGGVEVPDAR